MFWYCDLFTRSKQGVNDEGVLPNYDSLYILELYVMIQFNGSVSMNVFSIIYIEY